MNLEIVNLLDEEMKSLLFDKTLPIRLSFEKKKVYLFFYKNQVHGLYECCDLSYSTATFRHNGYIPCFYYASKESLDLNLAHYLLRQENKKPSLLSIQSSLQENKATFIWHHLGEKEFIQTEILSFDETIKNTLSFYEKLGSLRRSALLEKELKDYGKYLYNQFSKNFKNALSSSNYLALNGEFNSIFYWLYDGENFLCQRKRIKEHAVLKKNLDDTKKKKELFSLVLNAHQHDPAMKNEYNGIIEQFKKLGIPLSSHFSPLTKLNLSKFLENTHFFHYIGHATKRGIPLDEKNIFESSDFEKLSSVPKVLILSSCHGLSNEFKEMFFKKGGKTLIYFENIIDSEHMETIFKSFYWQFFVRRSKMEEIVLSIRRKLYKNNLSWLYLRLMGLGDLRYKGKLD